MAGNSYGTLYKITTFYYYDESKNLTNNEIFNEFLKNNIKLNAIGIELLKFEIIEKVKNIFIIF